MNGNVLNNKERQKKIIEYIIAHQGCNKEKAFKGVEEYMARVTFFNLIKELEEEGAIIEGEKKKPKSRDHKLFVNASNLLVLVPKKLEEFENAFFPLFEKAKREFEYRSKKSKFNSSEFSPIYQLISQPLFMFYQVVNSYYIQSLMLWPTIILEEDALKKLYTIVFTKIANMQSRISEILRSLNTPNMNVGLEAAMLRRMLYATEKMMTSHDTFTKFRMQKEMESLLDSLWKINSDYQEYAFPEPKIYGWNFKYRDDNYNWRKLIELQKQHPDQTYESYLNNYSNDTSGSNNN